MTSGPVAEPDPPGRRPAAPATVPPAPTVPTAPPVPTVPTAPTVPAVPTAPPVPTAVVALTVLTVLVSVLLGDTAAAAPAAAPRPAQGPRLELRISDLTPRVVTADGPDTLTVTGELTNVGDEPVTDVKIRPQRADGLRTEGELRTALAGRSTVDAVLAEFTPLAAALGPGQRVPVRLSVALRGSERTTLALQRPGVYPLLINVNGTPEGGERVRLDAVRILLPVLGLPPATTGAPTASVAATDPAGGNPVTVLYPLADQPRRLPTGPGEPVLLGDDALAAELGAGGRLDGLLGALETLQRAGPAGPALRDAVCLAVDPDLLRTVRDMAGGYRVRGTDGPERDGQGAEAAGRWLARLRTAASGHCVLALPFADADLVALSRAGLEDLAGYATRDGARIVGELLDTPVRADTTWPAEGLLDERSAADLLAGGGRTVVLSEDAVARGGRDEGDRVGPAVRLSSPRGPAGTPVALLADPLLTLAAGGTPVTGGPGDQLGATDNAGSRALGSLTGAAANASTGLAGSGEPLSGQDLTGAVVFRALDPTSAGSSLLIAPPHRWNTTGADARALLSTLSTLVATGRFRAAPLAGGPAGADPVRTAASASLVYPLRAGAREVPGEVTARLRGARDVTEALRSAAFAEPGAGNTPAQVFDPVTEGLLRASSAVWRGRPSGSSAATRVITDRVRLLRSLVRVLEPPSPYALGDREAPLPITLANGLPVGMNVRVALSVAPGLRTEAIPAQQIPPLGRRQLRVSSQLTRAGQFSVLAQLTTPAGAALGPTSRLQLRSTAYGTITLWLTGTAGALLVVLAAVRILRRTSRPRSSGRTAGAPMRRAGRPGPVPEETPAERTLGPMPPPAWPPPSRPRRDRPGRPAGTGPPLPSVASVDDQVTNAGPPPRRPRSGRLPTRPPPDHPQTPDPGRRPTRTQGR